MATRKKKPPPVAVPHDCVILAVDTAKRSGWCLYANGKYIASGEVDMLDPSKSSDRWGVSGWDADRVCLHAIWECGEIRSLPVVLVFERPFRGTTQGQWIGAWKRAWVMGGGHKRRMWGCYPATWRSRVLGAGWARAERAAVRKMETARAQAIAGHTVGGDEAAAVCLAECASRAAEIGELLPKRRRKVA